ncbi:hypothetical protein TNCV_486891 [Trichonephila clavipes]|nr:hypothetical protein TNCV_486891 [Trichonephila clavipes]
MDLWPRKGLLVLRTKNLIALAGRGLVWKRLLEKANKEGCEESIRHLITNTLRRLWGFQIYSFYCHGNNNNLSESMVEGPVDEGIDHGSGASEEENESLQVLAELFIRLHEDEYDHGDIVGGPTYDESENDDHGDHEGFDFGLVEDLVSGTFYG